MADESTKPNRQRLSLSLDFRLVSILLAVIVVVMLALWRPWSNVGISDRTITVTGDATVKASPDEFVFYPSYQFDNTDKDAALAELTAKSDTIVTKLKELGVEDNKIKTSSSGFDTPVYYLEDSFRAPESNYTLSLIVTVDNQALAQKVQDYLVTTAPTGSVSPQPTFSQTKQNELESQARDQATKDARSKADQSAKNLGFKVGKVKTISDGSGFGGVFPMDGRAVTLDSSAASADLQLAVQPGENELNYSVSVVYYIR